MEDLLSRLRQFNRKERFYLIGSALGNREFTLCAQFREVLGDTFGLIVPPGAFVAVDYHIDWIAAALMIHFCGTKYESGVYPKDNKLIAANIEDIDLLIGYHGGDAYHIILLEAKGATGWANEQMVSKATRFEAVFGEDGKRWPGVIPHFGLVSPRKPMKLNIGKWPSWMKKQDSEVFWMCLEMPAGLKRIERCDENGTVTRKGAWWKVSRDL